MKLKPIITGVLAWVSVAKLYINPLRTWRLCESTITMEKRLMTYIGLRGRR